MKVTRLGNVRLEIHDVTLDVADVYVGDTLVGMFGTVGGKYHIRRVKPGGGYRSSETVASRTDAILKLTGGDQ